MNISEEDIKQLFINGLKDNELEVFPVVKLHNQKRKEVLLLYRIDPRDSDRVYCLRGYNLNKAEVLGLSLTELMSTERSLTKDENFKPHHTIRTFIKAAESVGAITESESFLDYVEHQPNVASWQI